MVIKPSIFIFKGSNRLQMQQNYITCLNRVGGNLEYLLHTVLLHPITKVSTIL